jgi:bestrophin, other
MVNPHGEDDEDFNLSFLLNRHAKVINIGTNIFTEGMCPPMEDEHLLGGTGIHTPQASQKARIRRVLPKFAGLK